MEADIIKVMKNQGLVITEKRIWIIEAICQVGFVADVETFWLNLRAIRPVSWATTHQTLRLMTECGILRKKRRGHRLLSYHLVAIQDHEDPH